VLKEVEKFEQEMDEPRLLTLTWNSDLVDLFKVKEAAPRRAHLSGQSLEALWEQLADLRTLNVSFIVEEIVELSAKVSGETAMLRAINPSVWDAGLNVLRYAAFFRYLKKEHPRQWQNFMRQIRAVPRARHHLTIPNQFEP
jgi:hypothetical protein